MPWRQSRSGTGPGPGRSLRPRQQQRLDQSPQLIVHDPRSSAHTLTNGRIVTPVAACRDDSARSCYDSVVDRFLTGRVPSSTRSGRCLWESASRGLSRPRARQPSRSARVPAPASISLSVLQRGVGQPVWPGRRSSARLGGSATPAPELGIRGTSREARFARTENAFDRVVLSGSGARTRVSRQLVREVGGRGRSGGGGSRGLAVAVVDPFQSQPGTHEGGFEIECPQVGPMLREPEENAFVCPEGFVDEDVVWGGTLFVPIPRRAACSPLRRRRTAPAASRCSAAGRSCC
ncbi:hypothetical protein SCALM49S_04462 [Streptomyces californicus]